MGNILEAIVGLFTNKDVSMLGGHEDCGYLGYFKYECTDKFNGLSHAYYKCPCGSILIDNIVISDRYNMEYKNKLEPLEIIKKP